MHHLPRVAHLFGERFHALGLLAKGWKATKNKELVASLRKMVSQFKDILFVKVKGHGDDEKNIRVDAMARMEARLAGELSA